MKDGKLFVLYKDTAFRRSLNNSESGSSGYRYMLYGFDYFKNTFSCVENNLSVKPSSARWVKAVFILISKLYAYRYSLPFNFRAIWEGRKEISKADHILCTSDSITLPLAFAAKYYLNESKQITCITVGMADQLVGLSHKKKVLILELLNTIRHIICFSLQEKRLLESLFVKSTGRNFSGVISFIRFGVDLDFFSVANITKKSYDVCSIGSDSMRDFDTVYRVAKAQAHIKFCIVIGPNHQNLIREFDLLPNVTLKVNVQIDEVKKVLGLSEITWLPVKDNSYTGAFTVMLQSMSVGTPVLVTKVLANKEGYFLRHKENVFFLEKNSIKDSSDAINLLLSDETVRKKISSRARQLVEKRNNIACVYKSINDTVRADR